MSSKPQVGDLIKAKHTKLDCYYPFKGEAMILKVIDSDSLGIYADELNSTKLPRIPHYFSYTYFTLEIVSSPSNPDLKDVF